MRGIGQHENDALVFVRCQFRLGELEQHGDQAQHDDCEHQHHWSGVQGAMQHALVAALETFENHIEAMSQPAGVFIVAQQQGAHHR
ncbi:hypothetical protein D3C81_2028870 [compost metagenome]